MPLGVLPDHSGLVLYEAGYLPENDWWEFPNVLSPFWRLYYNDRPGHKVVFAHGEIELTPEHIMLIPDHQLFHCQGRVPVGCLWLAFHHVRRLTSGQAIPVLLTPGRTERAILEHLVQALSQEGPARSRERIFHSGLALLHVVLCRPEFQWLGDVPPAVVQVLQHIEKHYDAPLYLPRLARMTGLSTESLARTFKRYQGMTLGQFILKVRVREAAHRLTQTDMSLDEIAEKSGFPNRAYLSRVFKRVTGESPAEFRRRH